MKLGQTIYVTNRKEWRRWLAGNFKKESEIWLIYPTKSSGQRRIPYNEAVEEALSFGWIDSTQKKIDAWHTAQRFSPRNPKSPFSQANKERLRWLAKTKRLHPSIKALAGKALKETFVFPPDIVQAIKADGTAWKNYLGFSPAYRRIRVAFIEGSRNRPQEFKKRLSYFIKMTRQNRQFGFGGIEKYY
jgi:uncharacterized protein YdeI (YjbR/CyaY-like superfamily)